MEGMTFRCRLGYGSPSGLQRMWGYRGTTVQTLGYSLLRSHGPTVKCSPRQQLWRGAAVAPSVSAAARRGLRGEEPLVLPPQGVGSSVTPRLCGEFALRKARRTLGGLAQSEGLPGGRVKQVVA